MKRTEIKNPVLASLMTIVFTTGAMFVVGVVLSLVAQVFMLGWNLVR